MANLPVGLALRPHPAAPAPAIEVRVGLTRPRAAVLGLDYELSGPIEALAIPAPAECGRADRLWRHTCFEAFLSGDGDGYAEFNFAPSGRWAAYAFTGYREGMAALAIASPRIEVERSGAMLTVRTRLDLPEATGGPLKLGLAAVIEAADGGLSYWALAHPAEKPDFHRKAGFVHEL